MARYDEDGRQVLDTAALDRHITGNYGEDQLSCSDVDDPLYEPSDPDLDTEDDEGTGTTTRNSVTTTRRGTSSVTGHRTKPMRDGESAAKFLRKDRLVRKLNMARAHGNTYQALEALFEFVNDQEVRDAWQKGLPKEDEA